MSAREDAIERVVAAARRVVETQSALSPMQRPIVTRQPVSDLHEALVSLDVAEGRRAGYVGLIGLRDPKYPCGDYEPGTVGLRAECETDGHYLCAGCRWNAKRLEATP